MRGVKDEEMVMSPLFPRLHVNDTEKGGPRAPPRNKMALYEQLSIPSQRLSSGSASILHLPSGHESSLVPSMSSSHGCGYKRNGFAPFRNSLAPSCLSEKVFPNSSDAVKLSNVMPSKKQESMSATNDHSLRIPQPLFTTAKCNSSQSQEFSNFNSMLRKKPEDENEFRVPSSAQSGTVVIYSASQHTKDQQNQPQLNFCFSMPIQDVSERHKRGTYTIFPKEKDENQSQENANGSQTSQDSTERSTSVLSAKGRTSVDASSSPAGKDKSAEFLKQAHPSPDRDYPNISTSILESTDGTNAWINQDRVKTKDKTVPRGKEDASKPRSESYTKLPLKDDLSGHENGTGYCEGMKSRQLQVEHVDRPDDSSETSMDSILASNITPDDVVGLIGEKQFWRARQAIVNHQRVFAMQVFELHRLIKVQKLIAESPHLLLQDDIYVGQGSPKVSPVKKLPSEYTTEQPCLILKPAVRSQRPHSNTELADENGVRKAPHAAINNKASKGVPAPQSNQKSHSGSAPPLAMPTNAKPIPWCVHPPGNQCLVPVMSPSEGLVYKPYTGPFPPTAGFMAPFYGGCAPMSIAPGNGDFSDYCLPASHQDGIGIVSRTPLGQNYISAYGLPFTNPSISGSSIEQISPFSRAHSKDNELSVENIDSVFPRRSSSSMPSQASRVICAGKYQASKGSDIQGSTASSPSEKAKGNELPLFPTEPTVLTSDQNSQTNKQYAHVVRVVPHNPRSAMESAARIFQSIQEERNSMTNS
uniref:Protein disulfide-isomerase n=1 Tax=Rhizophora mucronata TaxID=61149 RepID=A0A2P2LS79_RHIMU